MSPSSLRVASGRIVAPDGRSASYGEVADAAARLPPREINPPPLSTGLYIGKGSRAPTCRPRRAARRATASTRREPGQLYAAIRHAPRLGGRLADASLRADLPGVRGLVRGADYVAIVADRFATALAALDKAHIVWDERAGLTLSTGDVFTAYRAGARQRRGAQAPLHHRPGWRHRPGAARGQAGQRHLPGPVPGACRDGADQRDGARYRHSVRNLGGPPIPYPRADARGAGRKPAAGRRDGAYAMAVAAGSAGAPTSAMSPKLSRSRARSKARQCRRSGPAQKTSATMSTDLPRWSTLWPRWIPAVCLRPSPTASPLPRSRISSWLGSFRPRAPGSPQTNRSSTEPHSRSTRYPTARSRASSSIWACRSASGAPLGSASTASSSKASSTNSRTLQDCALSITGRGCLAWLTARVRNARDSLCNGLPGTTRRPRLAQTPGGAKTGRGFAITEAFHSLVGHAADVEISGTQISVRRVFVVVDCGFAIDPPNVVAQGARRSDLWPFGGFVRRGRDRRAERSCRPTSILIRYCRLRTHQRSRSRSTIPERRWAASVRSLHPALLRLWETRSSRRQGSVCVRCPSR